METCLERGARPVNPPVSIRSDHTDMILAQQALEMNNLGRARELLERPRPAEKSGTRNPISPADIRGWEWHYLWNLSQSDELPSSRLGPCALGSHSVVPSPGTAAKGSLGRIMIMTATWTCSSPGIEDRSPMFRTLFIEITAMASLSG